MLIKKVIIFTNFTMVEYLLAMVSFVHLLSIFIGIIIEVSTTISLRTYTKKKIQKKITKKTKKQKYAGTKISWYRSMKNLCILASLCENY